jgi:hypothetical protein
VETTLGWLTGEFSVLGIQFQNWMLIAAAIVIVAIFVTRK